MADDEQFSLCWNNFNTNLSAGFHESLCRGDLVDVSLAAEGQIVKAHRLVLSVCSPFFRKMFTQMPPNAHAFVFLNNVSHSALKDLIQFMYCGEVNVKQDALPAFISTAESLQIKGLTDNDPAPQPPQEPTPPPPAAPHVQQQQQQVPTQRVQRQQPRASARYKIETVDDVLGDDKGTTQIVIQTTTAPQATIVQQQQQQQQQQQTQHIQTQQQLQTGTTTTATLVSTNKRTAQRGSLVGSGNVKRSKTTTTTANVIDPLDTTPDTATTTTTAQQLASQQITVQTTVVPSETKVHQVRQQQAAAQEEAEYIDLPMELPTKSEPDYSEDHAEVAGDGDTTYVEDDTYGDMRYDDSYFTENEDAGAQTAGGNTSAANVSATTSKAVVKQQSQSYSDSSFVDTGADQGNTEAQEGELLFIESPWSTPCLVLNNYMYNCHSRKNNKEYWRCHNYSKKVHEQRCRSRCVLEFGKLKNITGGLHNHAPHTEKIEKIIQRNRLAAVNTGRGGKLARVHSITDFQQHEPKQEVIEMVETVEGHHHQQHHHHHHLLASEAATLQLTETELMHASLMLIHD
ncbi:modifier of mdg4-like isoform X2 [Drosophila sulfurigaster albostrigata]|uniref:modifier of mdg4-like isoform X2 n=1 Tax=Drosophila sulfurigaster albostrigata TaxID=89887 RepID=UPI002D21ECC1|nr:modifier of mdg4-like isoform X2 [Drosophila sulfurigaster albostrigata]